MHLPKAKHENILNGEPKLSAASLYYKMIIETLIERPHYNLLNFKTKNEITIKLHY